MALQRKIVLAAAASSLVLWVVLNFEVLLSSEGTFVRAALGTLFAILIMFRPKLVSEATELSATPSDQPYRLSVSSVLSGVLLLVLGIVFGVTQFRWIGILLVLFGSMTWALPQKYWRDVLLAAVVFYWVGPLPSQVVGPIRLMMQRLSVGGSEWMLHVFNTRVWADEMVLVTATSVFEVPQACSGMKTVMTALVCSVGIGTLLRFRWYETVLLLAVGLSQVLLLNILRISVMILLSGRTSVAWTTDFLHDTTGVFMLLSVLLVHVEALSWRRWSRRRVATADLSLAAVLSRSPLRMVSRIVAIIVLVAFLVGGSVFAVFKSRPYHRAMMIVGVVDAIAPRNPARAERAAAAALRLAPSDTRLIAAGAKVLILRRKSDEALQLLERVKPSDASSLHQVLRAVALMDLGRREAAADVIAGLPGRIATSPGVAMVRAELAAAKGDTKTVVENIQRASMWDVFIGRVRGLFPYLAARDQWSAIVGCYSGVPHGQIVPLLIDIDAHLRNGNLVRSSLLLKHGLVTWPGDHRLIQHVATMAKLRPGSTWEDRLGRELKSRLDRLSADELASFVEHGFQLARPDLAWLAYRRLAEIDKRDPALFLAPAKYGDVWFTFRKHQLGREAINSRETVDLRSEYLQSRHLADRIPLAEELATGDLSATRKKYAIMCLKELDARRNASPDGLSSRFLMMYPRVLALLGRYEQAHDVLDKISAGEQGNDGEILLRHAALHMEQGNWQALYEVTRRHSEIMPEPTLDGYLMQMRALVRLGMASHALRVADTAAGRFADAEPLQEATVGIWAAVGDYEEAISVIARSRSVSNPTMYSDLLLMTERFKESQRVRETYRLPPNSLPASLRQRMVLPPAEWSLDPRLAEKISTKMTAKASDTDNVTGVSPFVTRLKKMSATWLEPGHKCGDVDIGSWEEAGRDSMEKAEALHMVAAHLALVGRKDMAMVAARRGVELVPESRGLWRLMIVVSGGEPDIVQKAYKACSSDSEIWLARLVSKVSRGADEDWAMKEVRDVSGRRDYSVGARVRAGDFLLRRGMVEAAAVIARSVSDDARGLLPAHVLAIGCAMASNDHRWLVESSRAAAAAALDPSPFLALAAAVYRVSNDNGGDVAGVLEELMSLFPGENRWPEMLGHVYLQAGDPRRAFMLLKPLIVHGPESVAMQALLDAAEAARLVDDPKTAGAILELAWTQYPESCIVLNNLVYGLAFSRETLPRAEKLLARLLESGDRSLAVLDTAVVVYRNAGQFDKAASYLQEAIDVVADSDPYWLRRNPNVVDMATYEGKRDGRIDAGMARLDIIALAADRVELLVLARKLSQKISEKIDK